MRGAGIPPSALPALGWTRLPPAVPFLTYCAPSLADATLLAGFDIDHARGCFARVPVVFPQNLIDAGAVVSVLPVLALLPGVSYVPVELITSAAAVYCRCLVALVCF